LIAAFYKPCGKTYEEQHKAAYELLYAAASFLGLTVGRIEKTEAGKPYFPESEGIFFSIAHADGMAAVAIGNSPCGIDVEGERDISERIRKKYLEGAPESEALLRWTERESYGKYEGSGFFAEPNYKDVSFSTFKINGFTVTICTDKNETVEIKEI
jgi:phosphopantetheinyl transferase